MCWIFAFFKGLEFDINHVPSLHPGSFEPIFFQLDQSVHSHPDVVSNIRQKNALPFQKSPKINEAPMGEKKSHQKTRSFSDSGRNNPLDW